MGEIIKLPLKKSEKKKAPKKKKKPANLVVPEEKDLLGKKIQATNVATGQTELVTVESIRGCLAAGDMPEEKRLELLRSFEINGTHLCPMLSFFIQVEEGRLPTPEEEQEFNLATQVVAIKEING